VSCFSFNKSQIHLFSFTLQQVFLQGAVAISGHLFTCSGWGFVSSRWVM